jgi:hypothetical protein
MFKTLLKNKKAQNTAEYALLIALVVAGVIAMQTYAQRALQARVRDASMYLTTQTSELGKTNQYEPYYMKTNYTIDRQTNESTFLTNSANGRDANNLRGRVGRQDTAYNGLGLQNGI